MPIPKNFRFFGKKWFFEIFFKFSGFGWTGELWLNHTFIILRNKNDFFFVKKIFFKNFWLKKNYFIEIFVIYFLFFFEIFDVSQFFFFMIFFLFLDFFGFFRDFCYAFFKMILEISFIHLEFLHFFLRLFWLFSKLIRLLLKITEVTTEH